MNVYKIENHEIVPVKVVKFDYKLFLAENGNQRLYLNKADAIEAQLSMLSKEIEKLKGQERMDRIIIRSETGNIIDIISSNNLYRKDGSFISSVRRIIQDALDDKKIITIERCES